MAQVFTQGPREALTDLIENVRDAMNRLHAAGVDVSAETTLIRELVQAQEHYYVATHNQQRPHDRGVTRC